MWCVEAEGCSQPCVFCAFYLTNPFDDKEVSSVFCDCLQMLWYHADCAAHADTALAARIALVKARDLVSDYLLISTFPSQHA